MLGFASLQAVGQVLTMAVPLLIAKTLTPDAFGRYSFSEIILFFCSTLFFTSAKTAIVVTANQELVQTGKICKTFAAHLLFLIAAICGTFLLLIIFQKPLRHFAAINASELLWLGMAVVGWVMKDFLATLQLSMNQKLRSAFTEIAFGTLSLIALAYFWATDAVTLKNVFISYGVAGILTVLIALGILNYRKMLPLVFDRQWVRQIATFALWTCAGTMAVYFINWGGLLVMRKFSSFADAGTYNLAYKFFKGFMAMVYIFPAYFLPTVSAHINNSAAIRTFLNHKRPRIMAFGIVCLVFAYFLIPYAMNILYENKFPSAVPVARLLLIAATVFLYTTFHATIVNAAKAYKFTQFAYISQVVINMILNIVLIPSMGMYGAAIATVVSYIYLAIIFEHFFRRKLKKMLFSTGESYLSNSSQPL